MSFFSGSDLTYGNKKALSPFYHKKYFLQKVSVRHPMGVLWVAYIHFLSKIFFTLKWTLKGFLFLYDEIVHLNF